MTSRATLLWLLLIATISVTAVAGVWLLDEGVRREPVTIYLALTFGELSVLCAAIVASRNGFRAAWLLPFVLGLLAAYVMALAEGFPESGWRDLVSLAHDVSSDVDGATVTTLASNNAVLDRWEPLASYSALFWLHVAVILIVLWMLRPTALFQRFSNLPPEGHWRFSIAHLLILMTCVALLCMCLSRAILIIEDTGTMVSTATLPIANCLLMVSVLWATQSAHHFFARLSISLSAAMMIAAVCGMADLAFSDSMNIFVYALLQALMMWVWFELMRPTAPVSATGDAPTLSAASP